MPNEKTTTQRKLDFDIAVSNNRNVVTMQRRFERKLPALVREAHDGEIGQPERALDVIHEHVGNIAFSSYLLGLADGANEFAEDTRQKLLIFSKDAQHIIKSWRGLALAGWASVVLTNVTWYFWFN